MINWTRVGMPLPAGKTNINQGTLTIINLSPADNGFYDCVATNVMGTKKKRINLAVQVHRSGLYRHRLTLYIPNSIKVALEIGHLFRFVSKAPSTFA